MENYSYENLLRRNKGLLGIHCKMPIRDRGALSLVYTPGVGASCLEIKRNPDKAYDLTNKKNSMFILTDSSGFKEKNNNAVFPYLEAICVY
jgi:malate dehydrogenase (oxaloacetate-decarboxylating)